MDHTHYARWIPVHLKDMAELPTLHPEVAQAFMEGRFTVQKTKHVFSSMAMDHAHEQMNASIKGDGGAVGITENPSALMRWMVAGPEIARCIQEFEVSDNKSKKDASPRPNSKCSGLFKKRSTFSGQSN